ncbi:MAG: TrmH family RNA methyltransferase [Flavobacteriales bacterium]
MISKGQIKLITSLQQKKYRNKEGLFIAEGAKVIGELLNQGLDLHSHFHTNSQAHDSGIQEISEVLLQKISCLKTANTSLATFKIPAPKPLLTTGLTLVVDAVRDPGNLGTIIRLCDWFGVTQLVCSLDTVDCYNPKVVQATMGSIARVSVHYLDIYQYLKQAKLPVYTATMDGENVYDTTLASDAILIMGNEANGVSQKIKALSTHQIAIAQFGELHATESLNVASATAILLSEFARTTEM